eukprot:UN19552
MGNNCSQPFDCFVCTGWIKLLCLLFLQFSGQSISSSFVRHFRAKIATTTTRSMRTTVLACKPQQINKR